MQHVGRVAHLPCLAVDVEAEVQVLYVGQFALGDKFAYGCTAVECLRHFPRQAFAAQTVLQVACREVDAQRHLLVVAVGKPLADVLAQAADAHDDLGFVVESLCEVGHKEGVAGPEQRRVGLGKDDRLLS